MIQFHNATDTDGKMIHIDEVTQDNRAEHYFCIGCGKEMSAVLGEKREHHFRHKEDTCSWESYLHQLGKKLIKQRFETSTEFIVQYYGQSTCQKWEECKLRKSCGQLKCQSKLLFSVDLKNNFDTCEEEAGYKGFRADLKLTHSEYPEREPIFLEIFVTHECKPDKIASGIKIIEIKINSEIDALQPIIENEGSMVESKPYTPYNVKTISPIRFYNFERNVTPEYLLNRFCLYRDENGLLRGRCEQNKITCQNVETEHNDLSLFEVAILEKSVPNKQKYSLNYLGMALAINKGFEIKNCIFCNRFRSCVLIKPTNQINPQTGKPGVIRVPNHKISKDLDRTKIASSCPNYQTDNYLCSRIISSFNPDTYWEWLRDHENF